MSKQVKLASWVKSKKLTKANSIMLDDTIFYIGKKDYDEKASKLYCAYTYPEGICVMWGSDKDALKEWLDNKIGRIEYELKKLKPEDYL